MNYTQLNVVAVDNLLLLVQTLTWVASSIVICCTIKILSVFTVCTCPSLFVNAFLCSRWWSLSMLTVWRFATLNLWTRKALYVQLCGTQSTTPSSQTPTTGQVSTSAPRSN